MNCCTVEDTRPAAFRVVFGASYTLVGISIVFAQLLIIIAALRFPRIHRTPSNILLTSLACGDLLVGLHAFMDTYWVLTLELYSPTRIMCLGTIVLGIAAVYNSIFNLFAICIERFVALTLPLKYHTLISHRSKLLVIVLVWLVTLLHGVAVLCFNHFERKNVCSYVDVVDLSLSRFLAYEFFAIAAGIIAMYTYIGCLTGRYMRLLREDGRDVTQIRRHRLHRNKEAKTIVFLGIVITAFLVSWLPIQVLALVMTSHKTGFANSYVMETAYHITMCLGYTNSALNAVIYAWKSKDYRHAFSKILHYDRVRQIMSTYSRRAETARLPAPPEQHPPLRPRGPEYVVVDVSGQSKTAKKISRSSDSRSSDNEHSQRRTSWRHTNNNMTSSRLVIANKHDLQLQTKPAAKQVKFSANSSDGSRIRFVFKDVEKRREATL